jgi:hypothetical protein
MVFVVVPFVYIILYIFWMVCVMITGFLSETKYYNIFPNQSEALSKAFRVIIWIGHVIVLALSITLFL